MPVNKGPIPGANFTSDTKNYPWHQPPEFVDLDEALEMLSEKLTEFKVANGIATMAEMEIPLTRIADMILTQGISEGKWTPDFCLLLAGPTTRLIELICKSLEVDDYTLGIEEDDDDFETGEFYRARKSLEESDTLEVIKEELPEIIDQAKGQKGGEQNLISGGFMAMNKPQGEQTPGAPTDGAQTTDTGETE